ncbi:MAG TPA: ribosomal-protein-alanine N-acetyltransferase RimI, partial [Clostridiales bacterium]|nr:ribosomal-protein-alanine N-acetyltransferase RimI [Clostridiales bacterium]
MSIDDLDQVMDIEAVSFPTPWSRQAYRREIADNSYAHYLVMLAGREVIGYGGMWVVLDEAHVT